MTKSKFRTITIAALSFLLVLLLSLAAGMVMPRSSASAEEYTPTNIFSAGTDTTVSHTEEGESDYISFAERERRGSVLPPRPRAQVVCFRRGGELFLLDRRFPRGRFLRIHDLL